jgi:hypothetical protein
MQAMECLYVHVTRANVSYVLTSILCVPAPCNTVEWTRVNIDTRMRCMLACMLVCMRFVCLDHSGVVCVCVCVCVRARVRACVCVRVRACVHTRASINLSNFSRCCSLAWQRWVWMGRKLLHYDSSSKICAPQVPRQAMMRERARKVCGAQMSFSLSM